MRDKTIEKLNEEARTKKSQELARQYYEKLFDRIDKYHSITGLSEELDSNSPFWEDKTIVPNEVGPYMIKHKSLPYWQDGITTLVYMDDDYTYVANYVVCYDGHAAPPQMCSVLRLDKKVKEGRFKAFEPMEESVQLLKDLTIRKESKGE